MADDGDIISSKRIKTRDENEVELRRRNAELEARLRGLQAENERLRAENALLRRDQIHDVLPMVVPDKTVDIPRLDAGLVAHIASFVGTSNELRNLALTCKAIGWQRPGSSAGWSLVEGVARQVVCSGKYDIEGTRITLPEYVGGKTTWLSILHESEHPLKFDLLLGRHITYLDGRKSAVQIGHFSGRTNGLAIASGYVMKSGTHYAEFQFPANHYLQDDSPIFEYPYVGIVRPMQALDRFAEEEIVHFLREEYRDHFLAQRTDEWGSGNVHACFLSPNSGHASWTGWEDNDSLHIEDWEGSEPCELVDTVGMLLDLDEGTLAVYKNNRRLGVMIHGLSGTFCWQATLVENTALTIKKGKHPTIT